MRWGGWLLGGFFWMLAKAGCWPDRSWSPGCRCCPSPWSGPGAGVRAAGAAGLWPACSPWPEPFFRCAPSSPGTAIRSGCPSLSSVLRCWPGWWSGPAASNSPATQSPLALAAVAASNVLVRARAAAPAALAEQLQQHRQQPLRYRGLAVVLGLGWCAHGWWLRSGTTATTPWGDQPQLRQCGSTGPAVSIPLWLWELNETWPVQPVAALARANVLGGEIGPEDGERPPAGCLGAFSCVGHFSDAVETGMKQLRAPA